ncbi:hypothetical protein TWF696_007357 [Orbilia brochopaga]|uniref:Uncharacterized protein n=1 Tax=Orbilia brochopaga TaxID=3140254 RepID=A0AAV9USJ5_9PEZI
MRRMGPFFGFLVIATLIGAPLVMSVLGYRPFGAGASAKTKKRETERQIKSDNKSKIRKEEKKEEQEEEVPMAKGKTAGKRTVEGQDDISNDPEIDEILREIFGSPKPTRPPIPRIPGRPEGYFQRYNDDYSPPPIDFLEKPDPDALPIAIFPLELPPTKADNSADIDANKGCSKQKKEKPKPMISLAKRFWKFLKGQRGTGEGARSS